MSWAGLYLLYKTSALLLPIQSLNLERKRVEIQDYDAIISFLYRAIIDDASTRY